MQTLKFGEVISVDVESVSGGSRDGRETLSFTIPVEVENITDAFEEFYAIAADEAMTGVIAVLFETTDEGGEAVITENIQEGYTVFVSLDYVPGKFILTLGKQTQAEMLKDVIAGFVKSGMIRTDDVPDLFRDKIETIVMRRS